MLMRELKEGWRSFRLPGVLLGAVFFALLAPPTQKYMDVILGMFAEGLEVVLPLVTPESVLVGFAGDMTSIIMIAAIIVSMGIVAREKHNGLAEWFLTRPVNRSSYLYAKALYVFIFSVAVVGISITACALYTYTLIGPFNTIGVLYLIILLTTYFMIPLVFTVAVSAITGIAGAAAGAGIAVMFVMSTLGWLLSNTELGWLPTQLAIHLPEVMTGSPSPEFWVSIVLSWLIIVLVAGVANFVFSRQEL